MTPPIEFTPAHIEENSPREKYLYGGFNQSSEPYRSIGKEDFHISARHGYSHDPSRVTDSATPGVDLDDDGEYYNTGGSAAEYWGAHDLPKPVKDIHQLRHDLQEWGYCLVDEAFSSEQLQRIRTRVAEQAEGERLAGIANFMGTPPPPGEKISRTQFVHALINKGEQFIGLMEHDPEAVQAGPLIEQLITEAVPQFMISSLLAIIARPYNMPQGLHQDQGNAPFQDPIAPLTCNTMFILDDLTAANGGTLVVPGSHRIIAEYGSGNPITEPLPPAINLEAPAGTVMLFEGRLLHGTGVNTSDADRHILVMQAIRSYMRHQEQFLWSTRPEIIEKASQKLLYRIGAFGAVLGGIEGSFSGEYLVNQRLEIDGGQYLRVGELSSDSPVEDLAADYGVRRSTQAIRQFDLQPSLHPEVAAVRQRPDPRWTPPT